jgi:hypothetical protein
MKNIEKKKTESIQHYHNIGIYHWECSVYGAQLDECVDKMSMLFPTILSNPFDRENFYKELENYKINKSKYDIYMKKLLESKSKMEKIAQSLAPK